MGLVTRAAFFLPKTSFSNGDQSQTFPRYHDHASLLRATGRWAQVREVRVTAGNQSGLGMMAVCVGGCWVSSGEAGGDEWWGNRLMMKQLTEQVRRLSG